MSNIWKIFTTDIRRISNNVVAVVIIMGLSILPALYAWFNIFSNWDPYEPAATSQLKVAVASDDAGASLQEPEITAASPGMQEESCSRGKQKKSSWQWELLSPH